MRICKKRIGLYMVVLAGLCRLGLLPAAAEPLQQQWLSILVPDASTPVLEVVDTSIDKEGNAYFLGRMLWNGPRDRYPSVVKYDSNGNRCWMTNVDRLNEINIASVMYPGAMTVDDNGYFYVAGSGVISFGVGKYDPNGVEMWSQELKDEDTNNRGAEDIVVGKDGTVFITGIVEYFTTDEDIITFSYGPEGQPGWVARFDRGIKNFDYSRLLGLDPFGNVFVGGESCMDPGRLGCNYGLVVNKYNSRGDNLWSREYHYSEYSSDYLTDMEVDNRGNAYFLTNAFHQYSITKYDPNGVEELFFLKSEHWPIDFSTIAMERDKENNFYILFMLKDSDSGSIWVSVTKVDSQGEWVWTRLISDPSMFLEWPTALALDSKGDIYVTSSYSILGDYGEYVERANLRKLGSDGALLWEFPVPARHCYRLHVDSDGYVLLLGQSQDYDPLVAKYAQHGFCSNPPEWDMNEDCVVNYLDLERIGQGWGDVYFLVDLAQFVNHWLDCGFTLEQDCY
ncbi:MAG: hypothetical protein JXA82_00375 [Sedimentisphaerales bacterium]|nr:hypothetical protein [Sedimentisphaerales bacterium]